MENEELTPLPELEEAEIPALEEEKEPIEEEQPPLEEKKEEEPLDEEKAPEEEEEKEEEPKPSPLEEAIKLVLSASEEDLATLSEETKKAYDEWAAKRINEGVAAELKWLKAATTSLANALKKNLDENEEFRILSKNTLQKNVQLLEDEVKFNQYNKILKSLATIYSTYCFVLETEIEDRKLRSNIEGIFEEMEILLEDYGVEKVVAKEGDAFDPVSSKVAKRIPTSDPALNNTVACFKQPGFKKGKVVLSYLRADMYVYEEPAPEAAQ